MGAAPGDILDNWGILNPSKVISIDCKMGIPWIDGRRPPDVNQDCVIISRATAAVTTVITYICTAQSLIYWSGTLLSCLSMFVEVFEIQLPAS